jgi:plasmid maintenance system antidote protein VapI
VSATPPILANEPITPEMALRIGKFRGYGPELWLRKQVTYDLWHARQEKMAGTLDHMPTVKAGPNMQARASECLNGDGR